MRLPAAITRRLLASLTRRVEERRPPDFVIGAGPRPYMLRWWVIPRNRFFNIYFHHFLRSDDDRALHDHPWASLSIVLEGGYWEHRPDGSRVILHWRGPGAVVARGPRAAHRVELEKVWELPTAPDGSRREAPARTLFITGPKVREWGFHCPRGWRHWREFCTNEDGTMDPGKAGRGCE